MSQEFEQGTTLDEVPEWDVTQNFMVWVVFLTLWLYLRGIYNF